MLCFDAVLCWALGVLALLSSAPLCSALLGSARLCCGAQMALAIVGLSAAARNTGLHEVGAGASLGTTKIVELSTQPWRPHGNHTTVFRCQ